MRISPKRLILSASDVVNIINAHVPKKLDLSFVNNVVKMSDLKLEFELMKTRNLPLLRSVFQAVERGDIVMCRADYIGNSIAFAFGVDKETNTINKVFINLVRYIKVSNGVDVEGNLNNKMEIIGGYEVLYNLLLSGYMALKTEKIFNSPSVVASLSELYTDIMSQLISRGFANPIDGEKFRFIVKYFFFNGKFDGSGKMGEYGDYWTSSASNVNNSNENAFNLAFGGGSAGIYNSLRRKGAMTIKLEDFN